MMQVLSVLLWALAILVSVPFAYLTLEVVCGLRRTPGRDDAPEAIAKTTILIPAHNEEAGIFKTVHSLRGVVPASCRILVIADNCSDQTANLAAKAGAEVVERKDAVNRGKGFALAFGRDFLTIDPPDAVIVVDADCRLTCGSQQLLTASVLSTGAPAQATNLILAAPDAMPLVQISNFAMLVKNVVRARGLQRLGGGGFLFGTGMAFPWRVFEQAPLATADVVEDLQLGISLAQIDLRVRFVEQARVFSDAAALVEASGQRRRWEHGFLQTALTRAMPLVLQGTRRRSRHLVMLGMHLIVPPLALLFLIGSGAFTLAVLFAVATQLQGPALLIGVCLIVAMIAVLCAWATSGREVLSGRALLAVPLYACWKIPIYVGFLFSRQTGWNRTKRPGEAASSPKETKS